MKLWTRVKNFLATSYVEISSGPKFHANKEHSFQTKKQIKDYKTYKVITHLPNWKEFNLLLYGCTTATVVNITVVLLTWSHPQHQVEQERHLIKTSRAGDSSVELPAPAQPKGTGRKQSKRPGIPTPRTPQTPLLSF